MYDGALRGCTTWREAHIILLEAESMEAGAKCLVAGIWSGDGGSGAAAVAAGLSKTQTRKAVKAAVAAVSGGGWTAPPLAATSQGDARPCYLARDGTCDRPNCQCLAAHVGCGRARPRARGCSAGSRSRAAPHSAGFAIRGVHKPCVAAELLRLLMGWRCGRGRRIPWSRRRHRRDDHGCQLQSA